MQEIEVGSKILLEGLREQAKLIDAQLKVIQSRAQWRQSGFQLRSLMGLLTPENLKLNVATYDPDVYYNKVRNKW